MAGPKRLGRVALLLALAACAARVASAQAGDPPTRYAGWAWAARPLPPPLAVDTVRVPPDRWLGRDKALHAAGSFLLTLSAQYVLTAKSGASEEDALPFSAGTALFLGVMKEVADSRGEAPHFSLRDLAADAVGVLLGVAVISW